MPDVEVGKPVQQILQTAERDHADLIVMASHGRSGLRRWVFGSVSGAVVHAARVPVLIVPQAEVVGVHGVHAQPEQVVVE